MLNRIWMGCVILMTATTSSLMAQAPSVSPQQYVASANGMYGNRTPSPLPQGQSVQGLIDIAQLPSTGSTSSPGFVARQTAASRFPADQSGVAAGSVATMRMNTTSYRQNFNSVSNQPTVGLASNGEATYPYPASFRPGTIRNIGSQIQSGPSASIASRLGGVGVQTGNLDRRGLNFGAVTTANQAIGVGSTISTPAATGTFNQLPMNSGGYSTAFQRASYSSKAQIPAATNRVYRTAQQDCNCAPGSSAAFQAPSLNQSLPGLDIQIPGQPTQSFAAPATGFNDVGGASYGGNFYSPLVSRPMPPGTYLGQGVIGQPTAYVDGQPFRNLLRYVFP